MSPKKLLALFLSLIMTFSLFACSPEKEAESSEEAITLTDMIGREVSILPGSGRLPASLRER